MLGRAGLRRMVRGRWFYFVLAGLVALGLLVNLAGAPLTGDAVRRAAGHLPAAAGPVDVLLEVPFSFVRVVWLVPPGTTEGPPPERRDPVCTFGEEVRAQLAARPGVARLEPGRVVAVTSPFGRVEVLSLLPGSAALAAAAGLAPGEVLVPEAWAAPRGIRPGDAVSLGYLNPERAELTAATYRVAGVFRPRSPVFARLITVLAEDLFTCPAPPDVSGSLDRAPPNLWLVDLRDGAPPGELLAWASERGYSVGGEYYPNPRLPLRRAWRSDAAAWRVATAGRWVFRPAGELLSALAAFVATGLVALLLGDFVERRRELATLKTLGFDAPRVARLILLEVALVGAAGLVLASLLAWPLFRAAAPLYPGGALPSGLAVLQALATVAGLLGAAALVPVALAQAATVNELLYNRPVRIWRQQVPFARRTRGVAR